MEKVKDIRAEIANNATHTKSKTFLKDLRDISRLYVKINTEEGLSNEEFWRFSIIQDAIRAEDVEKLRSARTIVGMLIGVLRHRKPNNDAKKC